MATTNNPITKSDLDALIVELEQYYDTLLKENRSITAIEASKLYEIQNEKLEAFQRLNNLAPKIEEIFKFLEKPLEQTVDGTRLKIKKLLSKIQILGRSNQQLLNSLEQHTNELLGNIAPEHTKMTYEKPRKRNL